MKPYVFPHLYAVNYLRTCLANANVCQRQLAERTGINKNYICQMLNGKRRISGMDAVLIEKALKGELSGLSLLTMQARQEYYFSKKGITYDYPKSRTNQISQVL